MNHDGLLRFLAEAGHTVAEGAGAGWYDAASGFFTAFPFDRPIDARDVQQGTFLPSNAIGARFVCRDDQGSPAWTIRCDLRNYDLGLLGSNTRSKVRRGLGRFEIGPIQAELLQQQGHSLNEQTLARQGRPYDGDTRTHWTRYFAALGHADGADLWGATTDGVLAAYIVAFRIGEVSHLMILRSSTPHLKDYVNNAILHDYLRRSLVDRGLAHVSFGLEPLGRELPQLLQFKESMGFRRVGIRQAVVLRPGLDRLLRSPAGRLIAPVSRVIHRSEKIARLAALANWVRRQDRLIFLRHDGVGG